jgi:hypothetical protein
MRGGISYFTRTPWFTTKLVLSVDMMTNARLPIVTYALAVLALTALFSARPAHAVSVDVALVFEGITADSTSVYSADLSILGLAHISSITLRDANTDTGGSDGQFSGFDLDAVFLKDSANNQINPTSFAFTAGTLRGGGPGPTFGATSETSIDDAIATLSVFDANDGVPDLTTVDGFLSLGDGGFVVLYFDPKLAVSAGLKLFLGEVNTHFGESVSVRVAETPLPAAFWMLLSGLLCLFSVARRRDR